VSVGEWVFLSGQIPLVPETGELVAGDFGEQARQVLKNLGQVLAAAGCSWKDVVSVDVFLTDLGRFAEFNGIYSEHLEGHKPARAVVEVKGLPRGALIEMKCVAHQHRA